MDFNNYNGFYIFTMDQKSYIFDIFNMECATIENHVANALSNGTIDFLSDLDRNMIKRLEEIHLFFYNIEEIEFQYPENINCIYFSLAPVTKCNLQCKYCFADAGNNFVENEKIFTEERINDIASFLINNFKNTRNFRLDYVSGGEPLLNLNALFTSINIFDKVFKINEKSIKFWMCTNATLLNKEILRQLDNYKVQIGISIDGDQEINDFCRQYKDGTGTYDDIKQSIQMIQNFNDISDYVKYVWGLSVITSQSKGLVQIIKHHKNLGIKNMQMKFVRLDKNSMLAIKDTDMPMVYKWIDDLIEFFYQCLKNDDIDTVMMFLNENDHLGKILKRLIIKQPFIYRCHAARNKFSFVPNGDIYPCDSFVGIKEYCIGNIYDGLNDDIRDKFNSQSVIQRPVCKECWARFVCGGDCFHNSYCTNKNISTPDSIFCNIVKYMIQKSLFTLNLLKIEKIKSIDRLEHILRIRSKG